MLLGLVMTVGIVAVVPAHADHLTTPAIPTVAGPITGPGEMVIDAVGLELGWPRTLEDAGYVFEEYFVSGTDSAGATYAVRALLKRPADLRRFSGHTLVEFNHSSDNPPTWHWLRDYLLPRGHGHIGFSRTPGDVNALRNLNPERYGHLHVEASQAPEIAAQLGHLLKSDQSPLPGVRWTQLTGFSAAAGPVHDYMATQHGHARLPDGAPIYDGFFIPTSRTFTGRGFAPDVDVPVMLAVGQLDVEVSYIERAVDYRKPDGDDPGNQFRLYEIAGMPHWDSRHIPGFQLQTCVNSRNDYPSTRVTSTLFDYQIKWIQEDIPPPPGQLMSVAGGPGGLLEVDEHGNALGGVRHTVIDVPTATYTAWNEQTDPPSPTCDPTFGSKFEFTDDELASLYRNRGDYVSKVNRGLNTLVADGWLLREYATEFRTEAAHFDRMR